MIRLNVFVEVSKENRAEALKAAKELTACSLKETGNVAYDIFESATREDVLMICETWADEAVLSAHEKTEHFIRCVGRIQQLGKMKLEKFSF